MKKNRAERRRRGWLRHSVSEHEREEGGRKRVPLRHCRAFLAWLTILVLSFTRPCAHVGWMRERCQRRAAKQGRDWMRMGNENVCAEPTNMDGDEARASGLRVGTQRAPRS